MDRTHAALQSPMRRRILALVRDRPGISVSEVARALDTLWTTAAFHVERLESARLVASARIGRRRVLFPAERIAWDMLEARGLLAEAPCRAVARAIAERPRVGITDLCSATGLSERAVYHHVKRLVDAGLVRPAFARSYGALEPTASLAQALDELDG